MPRRPTQDHTLPEPFVVIPSPRRVKLLAGKGLAANDLQIIRTSGGIERPALGSILSRLPSAGAKRGGSLTLRIGGGRQMPNSPEGYRLRITGGNAEIVARSAAGLFYGCQTLEQLLEDARDAALPIPACEIEDYPAFSYRAVHIDVKHHLDSMKYYYETVDRLARYKINAIIFEFEDKLGYRRRPLVAGPLHIPIDEMAALTRYARERHIEISPLVQGLGHATFILKHPQFAHLQERSGDPWAFCPLNEETYELQFDLYRDAIEATPGSRYLHIGGDEVGELGLCDRCKPVAEKHTRLELFLHWLRRVCRFAEKNGRIPIFWDDVPLKEAGVYLTTGIDYPMEEIDETWRKGLPVLDRLAKRFPSNAIYMRWHYNHGRYEGNYRSLDWYHQQGVPAMIATSATGDSSPLMPGTAQISSIRSFLGVASHHHVDGVLCTAWDDNSPHMETYWRGLIAAGEYSWNTSGRTLEEFDAAYGRKEFGPACAAAGKLEEELTIFSQWWDRVFLTDGLRWLFGQQGPIMPLPNPKRRGEWKRDQAQILSQAADMLQKSTRFGHTISNLSAKSQRNRFHWELLAAINELQRFSAELLLALQEADEKSAAKRKRARITVSALIKGFDSRWQALLSVYSRTRFLAYPPQFVSDRGIHLASLRENHDWIVILERDVISRVRRWLARQE